MENSGSAYSGSGMGSRKCNWWCISGTIFIISLVGLVAVIALYLVPACTKLQYGIIIDAGSSKSALSLYRWKGEKLRGTGELVEIMQEKTASGSGISSFANDPPKAGESLKKMLKSAEALVSDDRYDITPVYLGATGGMRILQSKNPKAATEIFESVRKTFKESVFKYDPTYVRMIREEEEGVYAWVTANLVQDNLGQSRDPRPTTGTLDCGGASTQISFQTTEKKSGSADSDYTNQKLYGNDYNVFAHSYLCFGQDEIALRYLAQVVLNNLGKSEYPSPCYHDGHDIQKKAKEVFGQLCTVPIPSTSKITSETVITFKGTGNPAECKKIVQQLLNSTDCGKNDYTHCFDDSIIPETKGKFMAMSAFFYVTNFLNATKLSYDKYTITAENFCKMKWDDVVNNLPDDAKRKTLYCFAGVYTMVMLGEKYGFKNKWDDIEFTLTVNGVSMGWALGMMTTETNIIPTDGNPLIPQDVFIGLVALFSVLLVVILIFSFRAWSKHRSGDDNPCLALCCTVKY